MKNQIALQGFQVAISNQELLIALVDGHPPIGVQNNGGKAGIAGFKNAELATHASILFFESKGPEVIKNFERDRGPFDGDHLDLLRPINSFQEPRFPG
ncbi:MAG: hypothetical protein C5B49_11380 [Bdellovibrio sp.]|nr:MAG: hypothetical protein C5B49_11380 [Bdellovibrio sp.]